MNDGQPPSAIAPLPDMQTCAICGYPAVGYWHDGGLFMCGPCRDAGHAAHSDGDESRPDAPACPLCGEGVWPANVSVDSYVERCPVCSAVIEVCPVCGPLNEGQMRAVHSPAYYAAYERLITLSAAHGSASGSALSLLSRDEQSVLDAGTVGAGGYLVPHKAKEAMLAIWADLERRRR